MENIMQGAPAQHVDLNDPKLLVGSWTMGEDPGAPARDRIGVMSIQGDASGGGRVLIAAVYRLREHQTLASVTDEEAAQLYRKSIVLTGLYKVHPSEQPELKNMQIWIDQASDPQLIGRSLTFKLMINPGGQRIGMGAPGINILEYIWWRVAP
jgi:hypothetical protein